MDAPAWRMNGLWRRMAGVLVLCALLLSSEVMCQDATDEPAADTPAPGDVSAATDAPDAAAAAGADATAPPDAGGAPTDAVGGETGATPAPGDVQINDVTKPIDDNQGVDTSGTSGTTAAPLGRVDVVPPAADVDTVPTVVLVVPDVKCVGKEDIPESNAVKLEVATGDCEATKAVILNNPAPWCGTEGCQLKVFQEGQTVQIASDDAQLKTVANVLQGETLKDKLGATNVKAPPSSSGSSVFVGLLVSGLLAAAAITVGYWKCQHRTGDKGVKLAEEPHPTDLENQGNTLLSVAPLNPPPETPEKPSVNGESPEAAKTQPPPPTNGHSTTKTADTEL